MEKDSLTGIVGIIALLAFLAFLGYLIWSIRQQSLSMITPDEIERARELARRLP